MSETVLPNHLIHFSETSLLKLPTSLYKSCKAYLSYDDIKKIQKAYSFAFYAHSGQKRKDGSDYITHPVAVTEILLDPRMDPDSVCSALMHDVLEDCNVQKNNLAKDNKYLQVKNSLELALEKWMISQDDILITNKMPLIKPTLHPLDRNSKWNKVSLELENKLNENDYIELHY